MSKITIYTLAKELNMTPSMVSRAFNPSAKISEEKRRAVLDMAEKYDFSPNKLASRLSGRSVHIGIVINSRFNVNTDKMLRGIRIAHDKLKDYKIQYDVTIINPENEGMSACATALDRYRELDGVIVSGMSAPEYAPTLSELLKTNKNLVQVQAVNKDVDGLFASKHDEGVASSSAAEFLANCLRGKQRKNILLFTGDLKSALHSSARDSFITACEGFSMRVIDSFDMKDNEEYFDESLHGVFEKYTNEVDGIYVTSGLSAPLCRYLEKSGLDIPLVTFDTYGEIKEYMAKGVVSATIAQDVTKQMQTAFDMLVRYIISGDIPPATVYTDVQLVLRSNMHQFD